MFILGILILVAIVTFVAINYFKTNKELRRCPKCDNIVKQKFDLKKQDEQFFILGENGQKSNVTVYKCDNCGYSWNHIYEISENVT